VVLQRLLAIGYGEPFELGSRIALLRQVANALNDGELALASIALLQMRLPPLPSADHARAIAKAHGLLLKENPDWADEPRVPAGNPDGGEWTTEDGDAGPDLAAARQDQTQRRKELFADAHLADTQPVADRLGVPAENILGLAAMESSWGENRFTVEGRNFFGIHYPAPYATGYMQARRGPARGATFSSYAESLRSFEAISGSIIQGVADPREFAAALQNSGKFGIDPDTGAKKPGYVDGLAATIRGLRSIVARRRP
jgi:hypothetical protein